MGIFDFLSDLFEDVVDAVDSNDDQSKRRVPPQGQGSHTLSVNADPKRKAFDWEQMQYIFTPEWVEGLRAETGMSTFSFHARFGGQTQQIVQEWQAAGRSPDTPALQEEFRQALRRRMMTVSR